MNMAGSIPDSFFSALPDLQSLIVFDNPVSSALCLTLESPLHMYTCRVTEACNGVT